MTAIVLGAILARVAVMLTGLARLDDPDRYLTLARSLAEGRGFSLNGHPTAYRPPLYPLALAPLVETLGPRFLPWGVGLLHLALGVGTVLLVARTARRLGQSEGRSLMAAAIVAFDPVLVVQSRSVMTETPAAFLVALTLAMLTVPGWRGAILGGIGFGLASLCRPSFLPAAILTALAALLFRNRPEIAYRFSDGVDRETDLGCHRSYPTSALGRGSNRTGRVRPVAPQSVEIREGIESAVPGGGTWRVRAIRAGLLGMATMATLSPWAYRNARIFGEPVWTTTHGGHTLALANNPVYYADVLDGPPGAVWSGPNQAAWFEEVGRETAGMSEPEADRRLRSDALRMVRERPGSFVRASLARVCRFWGLAPSGAVYPLRLRVLTALWTGPLWIALLLGLGARSNWQWPGIAAVSIPIALTLVHLVYWTDLRMRAPLVPAIALVAASARWPRRRSEGRACENGAPTSDQDSRNSRID